MATSSILALVAASWGGSTSAVPPASAAGPPGGPAALGEAVTATSPDTARGDAPGTPWMWPLEGPRHIVAPFRAPGHAYGEGHRGLDAAAVVGTDVRAPADGTVAFAGRVVDRPLLTIDHGSGHVSTLEPVEALVAPGEAVSAGDVIGRVGVGGHAASGSVHIGLRVHGAYANPLPLFGGAARAVLLPCCG